MRFAPLIAILAFAVTPSGFAQQMPSPGAWQAGPGAVGDNTYLGVVDTPSNMARITSTGPIAVSGWFVDSTAQAGRVPMTCRCSWARWTAARCSRAGALV